MGKFGDALHNVFRFCFVPSGLILGLLWLHYFSMLRFEELGKSLRSLGLRRGALDWPIIILYAYASLRHTYAYENYTEY